MTTNNPSEDKIDLLINRISLLENAVKEERKNRLIAEEELNQYKNITIPHLKSQLEEKENLLTRTFIEKIKYEKDLIAKQSNIENNVNVFNNNDKENSMNLNLNKLEYLENSHKILRKKFSEICEEKMKNEEYLNRKIDIEKEKNSIIRRECETHLKEKEKLVSEIRDITQANKNLLIEIRSLNNLLEDMNKQKEGCLLEMNFYKNEYQFTKQHFKDLISRIKKQDYEYILLKKTLEEYQTKISDMDTHTYIFSVYGIGRVMESYADLIFYNEGKGNYVLHIKHMTSSYKHDILDIEEISQNEKVIQIKFKPEKNLQDEKFRTNDEAEAIIKVFKEFQMKAYQKLDEKKTKMEEMQKTKKVEKQVEMLFSFFG